jgi:hypothetical protein
MIEHNRCLYLNNLFLDIGNRFILHEPKPEVIEYDSLAYANNVFAGNVKVFGTLGRQDARSLSAWKTGLEQMQALTGQTGVMTNKPQVENMQRHDFTPAARSLCLDRAAKVFVPWGLYAVVGEWGFYKYRKEPGRILGEHLYWDRRWKNRYVVNQEVPRNDLVVDGINLSDFQIGVLEDWIEGALRFDGASQYAVAENGMLLDMNRNNFLIEAVVKVNTQAQKGTLVSKFSADRGYALQLQPAGTLRMSLFMGNTHCSRETADRLDDGQWHHIVVEVDRQQPEGIRMFLDGKPSDGVWSGNMNRRESLANHSGFFIAQDPDGNQRLAMEIDFLRVSRGTLADAETDIQELYAWEFDGPFLKDIYGNPPSGRARDAGAVERRGQ